MRCSVYPTSGTELLVVEAETTETDEGAREALRSAIIEVSVDLIGSPPDEVVLAPPGTVLKTSSGKIWRAASRDLYQRGGSRPPRPLWWQIARFAATTAAPRLRRARRAPSQEWASGWSSTCGWGCRTLGVARSRPAPEAVVAVGGAARYGLKFSWGRPAHREGSRGWSDCRSTARS